MDSYKCFRCHRKSGHNCSHIKNSLADLRTHFGDIDTNQYYDSECEEEVSGGAEIAAQVLIDNIVSKRRYKGKYLIDFHSV